MKQEIKDKLIALKDMYVSSNVFMTMFPGLKAVQVRNIIRQLRQEGMLIIANNNGYMYTENEEKIRHYIAARRYELNREHQILKTLEDKYINLTQDKLFNIDDLFERQKK